ncbi:MAG: hypothetical protein CL767_02780 [Chloroflexi bacterium]|nr:hypothetical protein [Chloroflexota bacterium]
MTSQAGQTFIGRQPEMAALTAALDGALSGQGRVVMLAGTPGFGKTRTAQELASHAESLGARVWWGWWYGRKARRPIGLGSVGHNLPPVEGCQSRSP